MALTSSAVWLQSAHAELQIRQATEEQQAVNSSVVQAMSYSAVNGLGLALVIPAAQSLVADYYEEKARGGAFGLLFGVSSLGARPHRQAFQGLGMRMIVDKVCVAGCAPAPAAAMRGWPCTACRGPWRVYLPTCPLAGCTPRQRLSMSSAV